MKLYNLIMIQTVRHHTHKVLAYTQFGDPRGFPVLVQHGLIASITDQALFHQLVDLGARLICIARPGYGQSSPYEMENMAEWGDIAALLIDELKLPCFDVLGISSGAPYSYAIGVRFPEKTRRIFILSGTPALYDEQVLSYWPYPVSKNASLAEMQKLAYELFFSNLSPADLRKDDIRDSMMNDCFGIAQDLKLRCVDWGFPLSAVTANVIMRHSRSDASVPFITAELTSKLLPNCFLEPRENEDHFSQTGLDDFIRAFMAPHHRP
jgi:pimeloyl-ACP methyl ester carboxylesterase